MLSFLTPVEKSHSCIFVLCPFGSKAVVESMSNYDGEPGLSVQPRCPNISLRVHQTSMKDGRILND